MKTPDEPNCQPTNTQTGMLPSRQSTSQQQPPNGQGLITSVPIQQQLPNHQSSTIPSTSPPSQQTAPTTRPGLNPSVPAFTVPTSSALLTEANEPVLLQPALADVYDPHNPQSTLKV